MANHESEISVAERQIYILSLLSENPIGYTADEIVEKLKMWDVVLTKRTINRDIDELSMSYAIEEEERNGKTYYTACKFSLKNVDLTMMDLMAISFMKQLAAQYNHTTLGNAATEILNKLVANTGNLNKKHLEGLSRMVQISEDNGWKNQDINPEIETMISASIEKQVKIEIQYYSWNSDEVTTRVIHPYSLVFLDQYLCVEGFCELRNEIRTFRVSRIKQVKVLKDSFKIVDHYKRSSDEKFIYISGNEKEKLCLQFNRECGRYIKEYQAHRADKLTENEYGILFEKETAITDEVRRWIHQFGANVKVLSPKWLADDMKHEAEAIVSMY